jgi:hypothetical protein
VVGPVAAFWDQRLAIQDTDQVSFHTDDAIKLIGEHPLDEVDLKVRQVQEQLTLIETKNDKFNPLMKYHADPFDVAARVAGTAPGEKEYESNLPRYLANRSVDSKDTAP